MSTDIDWQHELDSSFGTGRDRPPGHYVAAGRTAVRRRRATAVVVAAAVVIGGGTAWAVGPGSGSSVRGDAPVATRGVDPDQEQRRTDDGRRAEEREVRTRAPRMSVEEEFTGNPAVIELDGTVKLSPLTDTELQRVANPMGYAPGKGRSVGLRVIYQGVETYTLVAMEADGSSTSTHTNGATGDFAGWLAEKVRLQQGLDDSNAATDTDGGSDRDAWLALGPGGGLVSTSPFVAVTEVREDVDLGDSFALDADRAGVARLQVGGLPEYVAWRVVAGDLEVIYGPGSFDSMAAFVEWARAQYASGEGMR